MSGIGAVEFVFLLLLFFIVAFGVLARKIGRPYPIIMVLGGLLLSFIPAVPDITLNPDLIFLVILPPLLYSSAWTTSWRDFRYNIVGISLLAFGLVAFIVIGVALAAPHVFPGFDWRLGLILGAIVAPTDAIAASSIARRLGLPARIVDILEGESLVNDASGLLALEFAIGILVHNRIPTVSAGLLAVVSCGLFLSRRSAHLLSPTVRIGAWSVWESLTFILNGLVFVLIGLQFSAIRASIHGLTLSTVVVYGLVFSALLILLRLAWVFPGTHLAQWIRTRIMHEQGQLPPMGQVFVVGWTGMRGVVSLAAALALPAVLADGSPFPQRDMIICLTFFVILVTLVLQGLTLPPLIRLLGLAGVAGPDCEELEARRIVTQAAVTHLEDAISRDSRESADIYEDLMHHYRKRLASLRIDPDPGENSNHEHYMALSLEALRIERETAIRLRNEGRINDTVLRRLERELDLAESRFIRVEE